MSKYTRFDLEDLYDDHINRTKPQILSGGLEYAPAQWLKQQTPLTYRKAMYEWIEAEVKAGELSIDGYKYDLKEE